MYIIFPGRGVGGFAGGILLSSYGTRATYQMFGGYAFVCGFIYFIAHKFYLSNMEKLRLRRKSGIEPIFFYFFNYLLPCNIFFKFCFAERVASIIASGEVLEDDEPNEKFIIPPDLLMGRRMSGF